ncbi:unnamed protein product [Ilex paraguariensis]|uniref:Werner Syndrome-like exonuclease n=1 Tax=Ilex paraguariensis TaxID=185542 RepID=A0ABC8RVV0_9AQUA
METEDNSSPIPPDWDQPFTDQELKAIEAAFQSATSSSPIKRRRLGSCNGEVHPKTRRRLPDSIFSSNSISLSPCPKNRFNNYHHSSYQAKIIMRYPAMAFGGRIVYSKTVAEVEKAANELLKFVEARKKEDRQVILGFDIEWKPTFRREALGCSDFDVMQLFVDISAKYWRYLPGKKEIFEIVQNPIFLGFGNAHVPMAFSLPLLPRMQVMRIGPELKGRSARKREEKALGKFVEVSGVSFFFMNREKLVNKTEQLHGGRKDVRDAFCCKVVDSERGMACDMWSSLRDT